MIDTLRLLEFGIFTKSSNGNFREKDGASPVGYYLRTDHLDLVQQTIRIEARLGLVFGIKYIVENREQNNPVQYLCRISHPPLTNPADGTTFNSIVEKKNDLPCRINTDFFEFEYEWELQGGSWSFEIIEEDKTLLKKKFTVFRN